MKNELHILQHSLGLDRYGRGTMYRNHFVAGNGSTDHTLCESLAALGLMKAATTNPDLIGDNSTCFIVTAAGMNYVQENSEKAPPPPKLSRGQKRYRHWSLTYSDLISFKEYLQRRLYFRMDYRESK